MENPFKNIDVKDIIQPIKKSSIKERPNADINKEPPNKKKLMQKKKNTLKSFTYCKNKDRRDAGYVTQ